MWPESLVREIAERRVLFFIGAGISKSARNAMPSWPELLSNLSQLLRAQKDKTLIRQLVRQGRMLDAAQIISDGSPKADLSAMLRDTFQIRPIPHSEIYENLLMMDPKSLVTTNYDEFLEKNFEYYSRGEEAHSVVKHKSSHLINDLRSPIRSIIKIHGCISEPNDLVLDRASYFHARRNNENLFKTLTALMTVNTVVFLGYSISDPDIQLILENVNLHDNAAHPHYALVSKFEHSAIKSAYKQTYNIEFIEHTAGKYEEVPLLIANLKNKVEELRARRGIV